MNFVLNFISINFSSAPLTNIICRYLYLLYRLLYFLIRLLFYFNKKFSFSQIFKSQ